MGFVQHVSGPTHCHSHTPDLVLSRAINVVDLIEFPEFLSDLVVIADNILIFGDFNIHMEKSTDPLQKAFGAIIDSVGFVQHVSGPTHCHIHTLDLVLSHGIYIVDLNVFPHNPGLLDHHLIMFAKAVL